MQESYSTHLIEPTTKRFLYNTLKQCHNYKIHYYSVLFNFVLFIIIFSVIGGFLYYRYKNRKIDYEKQQLQIFLNKKQITDKIQKMQFDKLRTQYSTTNIEQLPNSFTMNENTMNAVFTPLLPLPQPIK